MPTTFRSKVIFQDREYVRQSTVTGMQSEVPKRPESQMAAFNEVALQHLDGLIAMSLRRNQAESEDLLQKTYLRALRAPVQLRPDGNVKSWLFRILRNTRLNQVQRPMHTSQKFDNQLRTNGEH